MKLFRFSLAITLPVLLVLVSMGQGFGASTLSETQIAAELLKLERGVMENLPAARLAVLLRRANGAYSSLENYEALFYKTEKTVRKNAGQTEKIYLKYEKPWKIFMKWLNTEKKGLEVLYEKGKNEDKIAVHLPGLVMSLVPVIFLDQNSPWVRQGSESHGIRDAGIGIFLADLSDAVARASLEKRLRVTLISSPTQKSKWTETVDITFLNTAKDAGYFTYRLRVRFDRKTDLPVWMELFGWENASEGIYVYHHLKTNLKEDATLKKHIHGALYKVYRSDAA